MIVKIVVISDSHTDSIDNLPRQVLDEISGADMTIHAGDFTGKRLVDELRKIGLFRGVYGNIDGPDVRKELPAIDIVQAGNFKIGDNHPAEGGSPHTLEQRLRRKFPGVQDLGCGACRHSILLGKTGFQVVALDVSETTLKTLEGRLKTVAIDNITLVNHEMRDLPFVDNYFDGIVCTNVLHHGRLVEIKKAIGEVHRVMRRGSSAFVVALSAADFRKGNGRRLERNTYVFTTGEERGIIHHFFTREELKSCFRRFKILSFEERLIPIQAGGNRAHFLVKLRKP